MISLFRLKPGLTDQDQLDVPKSSPETIQLNPGDQTFLLELKERVVVFKQVFIIKITKI